MPIFEAVCERDDLQDKLEDLYGIYEHDIDTMNLDWALGDIESIQEEVLSSFETFLAYIKTFDEAEFDSIYCEREWRSISNFNFTIDDVAMIVLPKKQDGRNFYEEFCSAASLPRSVTIACWEDLIEH